MRSDHHPSEAVMAVAVGAAEIKETNDEPERRDLARCTFCGSGPEGITQYGEIWSCDGRCQERER